MSLMVHYRTSAEQARALQAELNALRADSVALVQADLLNAASLPAVLSREYTEVPIEVSGKMPAATQELPVKRATFSWLAPPGTMSVFAQACREPA
jgi:hypothetical protein